MLQRKEIEIHLVQFRERVGTSKCYKVAESVRPCDCNPLVYEMLTVMVIILGIQFLGTLGNGFKLFAEHSATDHRTGLTESENLGYPP